MNKIIRYNILLATALLLLIGCLRDSFDNCPRPFQITIRAFDADNIDITTLGDVERVILFLFDQNEQFIDTQEFSVDHIINRRPIDVRFEYGSVPEFIIFDAWANICDRVSFCYSGTVSQRTDIALRLNRCEVLQLLATRGAEHEVVVSPGDLFTGLLEEVRVELGGNEPGRSHVVDIFRRTAGVHIRAINLQAFNNNREGNYRFEVHGSVDALCHLGTHTGDWVILTPSATFVENNHFVTDEIFRMLASEDIVYQEEDIVINIFFENELIYSVDRDSNGNPFIPVVGRTLNIIIDLSPDGGSKLDVRTVVTPWNEVWQHVEWR